MMRLILVILIALLLPFCADCQDSILVPRKVLEKVASKLDSFDVLKQKEVQYVKYMQECDSFSNSQKAAIIGQDTVIASMGRTIDMLAALEIHYQENLQNSLKYVNVLEKQNKAHRIRNKVFLIGGCVLTVGLTTGLIISLLQ